MIINFQSDNFPQFAKLSLETPVNKSKHVFMAFGGTGYQEDDPINKVILNNYNKLLNNKNIVFNGATVAGHNIPLNDIIKSKNITAYGCTVNNTENHELMPNNTMNYLFDVSNNSNNLQQASWGFETFFFYWLMNKTLHENNIKSITFSFVNGGQITRKEFLYAFLFKNKYYKNIKSTIILQNNTGRFTQELIDILKTPQVKVFTMSLANQYYFKFTVYKDTITCSKSNANNTDIINFAIDSIYDHDHEVAKIYTTKSVLNFKII